MRTRQARLAPAEDGATILNDAEVWPGAIETLLVAAAAM